MHITELHDPAGGRILGIAKVGHAFDERLAGNPKLRPGQTVSERVVEVSAYPLFIVRRADGSLHFTDIQGAMAWLRSLPPSDAQHGTLYRIDADIFHPNQDVLDIVSDQRIDRHFLETVLPAQGERAILPSPYGQLASDYDLDALDGHCERLVGSDDRQEQALLAQDGYLALFSMLSYDAACNKLLPDGFALLLPLIAKAEQLLHTTLWDERRQCRMLLLDDAIARGDAEVAGHAERALEAIAQHLSHLPPGSPASAAADLHRSRALVHQQLAEHWPTRNREHWRLALASATTAVEAGSDSGWGLLLSLVHTPLAGESPDVAAERAAAQAALRTLTEQRCRSAAAAFRLVQEFKHLREHLAWKQLDPSLFPQADYELWLERAKAVQPADGASWSGTTEAGHLFHHEGVLLGRLDLVAAAMPHFAAILSRREPGSAMQVLYLAGCHEAMSVIAAGHGDSTAAARHLSQALAWWAEHLDTVRYNFSSLIQYVEFLIRVLASPLDVPKPPLAEIRSLALEAERDGQGFYSGPGLALAQLALHEGDEDEAIFHLTRLLILHECCMDDVFTAFRQDRLCTSHPQTVDFVDQTLRFIAEIHEGYYLDPQIRWPQLQSMDRAAVTAAWQARQVELRNRPKR